MSPPITTLDTLEPGDHARITGFVVKGALRRKLLALGLTPGAEISFIRVAPLGDPMEIRVRGFSLSLRKNEAAMLSVEKV